MHEAPRCHQRRRHRGAKWLWGAACAALVALPWQLSGTTNGYWQASTDPLFTCEEAGETSLVCAEWLTNDEMPLYEPCCIKPEHLGSPQLEVCPELRSSTRPSDFLTGPIPFRDFR